MRLLEMQLTKFLQQSAERGLVGKIFEKGIICNHLQWPNRTISHSYYRLNEGTRPGQKIPKLIKLPKQTGK